MRNTTIDRKKIPLVLITGFLGSGKTTFINWLLEHHSDKKVSLILNEFGDVQLESQFISQPTQDVIELANGCMCCVAKSDIPRTIKYILENSPQTEYIVIEASGLSDSDPVREALQFSSTQNPTYLEATICIVDAVHFEQMVPEHPIITSQVGDADVVVVSKVTEVAANELERLVHRLESMTPDVRVTLFDDHLLPEIFLTDVSPKVWGSIELENNKDLQNSHHHNHDHLHHPYQVYIYQSDQPLDVEKVSSICQNLSAKIIRIKGIFSTIIENSVVHVLLQRVGSHFTITEAEPGKVSSAAILFIGTSFNQEEIKQKLDQCKVPPKLLLSKKQFTLLSPEIEVGQVHLNSAKKTAMVAFYRDLVGLEIISETSQKIVLGFKNKAIITLHLTTELQPAAAYSAGLYHNAILFTTQSGLAVTLKRILQNGRHFFSGSADHHVSEAFYFTDPEGNGLELYFDRDPQTWQWHQGQVVMSSTYIDPRQYIAEHADNDENKKMDEITMGHIHLKVGSIQSAREFYVNVLGLVVTAEVPGALFVSDGKYHHHLGLNVWESQGASIRTESLGLRSVELLVQSNSDINRLAERLAAAGIAFSREDQALIFFDPWGNVLSVKVKFV